MSTLKPATKIIAVGAILVGAALMFVVLGQLRKGGQKIAGQNQAPAQMPATPAGGIAIQIPGPVFVPFSVLTIKGSGFDPQAAASIIFTTKEGEALAVPALKVTSVSIEVPVPPAGYNETHGAFFTDTVSVKVIQAKKVDGKLVVKTSNEVGGKVITIPPQPVVSGVPKGAVTRLFVALAVERLKAVSAKIQTSTPEFIEAVAKGQKAMEALLAAVDKINRNPGMIAQIKMSDGSINSLSAKDIAWMDAYYKGFLGVVEKQRLAVNIKSSGLVPVANAATEDACTSAILYNQGYNPYLFEFAKDVCYIFEPSAEGEQKPEEKRFKWEYLAEIPLFAGSLPYFTSEWSKPAQILLGTFLSIEIDNGFSGKGIDKNTYLTLAASVLAEMRDSRLVRLGGKAFWGELMLAVDIYDFACASVQSYVACMDSRSIMLQTGQIVMDLWKNPENFLFLTNEMVDGLLKPLVDVALLPANSSNAAFDGTGAANGGYDEIKPTVPKTEPEPKPELMPSPKPYSKTPITPLPSPPTPKSVPKPAPTCEQTKQATYNTCIAGCGKSDDCYAAYSACTPGCTGTGSLQGNLECVNTCLGTLSKCTSAASKCTSGCLNAKYATECP